MIGVPSVLAPTVEAMVAVPILTMTEVRIPPGSPGPPAVVPPYTDAASRSFPSLQPRLTPQAVSNPARPVSLQHRQYAIQREGYKRGQPAKAQHRHRHRQHRHRRKGLTDSGDGLHQRTKRAAGGPGDRHPCPSPIAVAARLDATTSQP